MLNHEKLNFLKSLKRALYKTQEYRKIVAANISILNYYNVTSFLGTLTIRINDKANYDPDNAKYHFSLVKNMLRKYLTETYGEIYEHFIVYPSDAEFLIVESTFFVKGKIPLSVEIDVVLKPEDLPKEIKGENCRIEAKESVGKHFEYKCDLGNQNEI